MNDQTPADELSAVKLALLARSIRSEQRELDVLASDPIAVIGMACRFPGASTPDDYWDLVRRGGDAVGEIPDRRWDRERFFDDDPFAPGKMNTRWGGFIGELDGFDADYFGVPPREAQLLDPQQRLWLEIAVEALERAGQPVDRLGGSATGVYVGCTNLDYYHHLHADPAEIDAYTVSGNLHCIIANRLSYLLDLRGPSMAIDTACSSSLVAIHLACQSLRSLETDLAVAGGVNLLISPEQTVALAKWGLMAPDGKCKTFDDRANGFVRSEGSGAVVLKRLSSAIADGDRIHAVIRGTATNQDGHSTTMSSPSGPAQEAAVRAALTNARLGPDRVSMVEAHGTGTSLGDPIEVEALAAVFDAAGEGPPIALTAAKTNIGHLEAAAGIAGFIKLVRSLEAREIPPPIHFQTLNRHIDLDGSRLYVPTELRAWDVPEGTSRVGGVSSFGFGGTNAHVVVEEAPTLPVTADSEGPVVLLGSAADAAARAAVAEDLADFLARRESGTAHAAATLAYRRAHHSHRFAIISDDRDGAVAALRATAAGEADPRAVVAERPVGPTPRVGFVFTGQGPQWWGMGRELLQTSETFRDHIAQCDQLISGHTDWSLLEELNRDEATTRLAATEIAQPALFALQTALALLWAERGVRPAAVLGHSVGEVAAAHTAGMLDLETAVAVIVARGASMAGTRGSGTMASVALDAATLEARIGTRPVSVAAVNSPMTSVISGETAAVDELIAELEADGISPRRLRGSYPFHSPLMQDAAETLGASLGSPTSTRSAIPFFSTVTGGELHELAADHWPRNVREPVRFADAVLAAAPRVGAWLELGPHPALTPALAETTATNPLPMTFSLHRDRPETETMNRAAAQLHCNGVAVDWSGVIPKGPVAPLPTYPWQRTPHWTQRRPSGADVGDAHPLLGRPNVGPDGVVFEAELDPTAPLLDHHRIAGVPVVPATLLAEMMLSAAAAVDAPPTLASLEIIEALVVAEPIAIRVVAERDAQGLSARIERNVDGDWHIHALARVGGARDSRPIPLAINTVHSRCTREIEGPAHYARTETRGLGFGASFRSVTSIRVGDSEALTRLEPSPEALDNADRMSLPPALLDSMLQGVDPLLTDEGLAVVPVSIGRLTTFGDVTAARWAHVVRRGDDLRVDVVGTDDEGEILVTVDDLRLVAIDPATVRSLAGIANDDPILHQLAFEPLDPSPSATTPGGWTLTGDPNAVATATAALEASGRRVATTVGADTGTHLVFFAPPPSGPHRRPARTAEALFGLRQVVVDSGVQPLTVVTTSALSVGGSDTDPLNAAMSAFTAGLAAELAPRPIGRLDIDPTVAADPQRLAAALASAHPHTDEDIVVARGDKLLAGRLVPVELDRGDTVRRLVNPTPGVLDNLQWVTESSRLPAAGEVVVDVHAVGLNFRDVLVALDMYPGDVEQIGEECAGVVAAVGVEVDHVSVGDRVVVISGGSFVSRVVAPGDLVTRIPARWSFAEAASVPVTFLTAHLALTELASLSAGQQVLIHAGAGGVGMAAIQLAHRAGATVIATAGSPEKRDLLRRLGVAHVFDSRSLDFADGVRDVTRGRGVDVVLNSLADDFIGRSVDVLADGGIFLEIGRRDIWTPEQMADARPDVDYHIVYLADIITNDPPRIRDMFDRLMPAFRSDELAPLPTTDFAQSASADAFRYMAQARHTGKVVIRPDQPLTIDPDATHIITGGTGGMGLSLASWLVEAGARRLVLTARTAPDQTTMERVDTIASGTASIVVERADVADAAAMRGVFDRIEGRVGGIIHAAGVTADGVIDTLGLDSFEAVLDPKAAGAEVLGAEIQERGADWIALMSAASTILGAPGQTNYTAANGYLDGLVRGTDVPVISLGWGMWANTGMISRLSDHDRTRLERRGYAPMSPADGTDAFGRALRLGGGQAYFAAALDRTRLESRPVLSRLAAVRTSGTDVTNILDQWAAIQPQSRTAAVATFVAEQARRVLGLGSETRIEGTLAFSELGLDSLMAVELRNALGAALGQPVPATLLFDHPTPDALTDYLLTRVTVATEPQPGTETASDEGPDAVSDVASLTEAEAEAELLAELERGSGA